MYRKRYKLQMSNSLLQALFSTTMSSTLASSASLPTAGDDRRTTIQANLQKVRQTIKAQSAELSQPEPLLIAVSTSHPVEDILACYELDQWNFGEHNAQELFNKATRVSTRAWTLPSMVHYIDSDYVDVLLAVASRCGPSDCMALPGCLEPE